MTTVAKTPNPSGHLAPLQTKGVARETWTGPADAGLAERRVALPSSVEKPRADGAGNARKNVSYRAWQADRMTMEAPADRKAPDGTPYVSVPIVYDYGDGKPCTLNVKFPEVRLRGPFKQNPLVDRCWSTRMYFDRTDADCVHLLAFLQAGFPDRLHALMSRTPGGYPYKKRADEFARGADGRLPRWFPEHVWIPVDKRTLEPVDKDPCQTFKLYEWTDADTGLTNRCRFLVRTRVPDPRNPRGPSVTQDVEIPWEQLEGATVGGIPTVSYTHVWVGAKIATQARVREVVITDVQYDTPQSSYCGDELQRCLDDGTADRVLEQLGRKRGAQDALGDGLNDVGQSPAAKRGRDGGADGGGADVQQDTEPPDASP